MMEKIRLGVAPVTRDFYFSGPKKYQNKTEITNYLNTISDELNFEVVTIEGVTSDGMLCEYNEVEKIKQHFLNQKIDALFIPFCNFGQEESVSKLASVMKLPLLIWGFRDEEPNGYYDRDTDALCGLFAAGKALRRYGIRFTYIENCTLNDTIFYKKFKDFLGVVRMLKTFKTLRIGQISVRPRQFLSVISNEGALLEKFGIEVVPLDAVSIIKRIDDLRKNNIQKLNAIIDDVIAAKIDIRKIEKDKLLTLAAIEEAFRQFFDEFRISAITSECWAIFQKTYGIEPCFAFGNLNDKGYPISCETDIYGAISSALAFAAGNNETPIVFADITIRHPNNNNAGLLWHCGCFPKTLKNEASECFISPVGQGFWELKEGELTITRFDELGGEYYLFADVAKTCIGPKTNGNYVWVEVSDWTKLERKFVCGPYIHHVSCLYENYRDVFKEFCNYIPEIKYDCI